MLKKMPEEIHMVKKMAILALTPEAVRQIMGLPDGVTLIELKVPFYQPGVVELKIEGAGWDTNEGAAIVQAPAATVMKTDDGLIIDWGLPDTEPQRLYSRK